MKKEPEYFYNGGGALCADFVCSYIYIFYFLFIEERKRGPERGYWRAR